jgi:hypothetical protein
LSDFWLDLYQSLAHQGFAKILDISTGIPAVFANPYASRFQHISSPKIAQLRSEECGRKLKNVLEKEISLGKMFGTVQFE